MKNPPIFARQANLAQGPQQVNNVMAQPVGPDESRARARQLDGVKNKLLEEPRERVDTRTTRETRSGDSALATVATLDRTAHG
jgi:hypothetical protein